MKELGQKLLSRLTSLRINRYLKYVEEKPRFMIYDRKEMLVLVLLGVLVALFSFTLGLHFGKKVNHEALLNEWRKQAFVATHPDVLPSREELAEQMKHVNDSVELTLGQALKKEVDKTGIQLKKSVQVELPKKSKSKEAGATSQNDREIVEEKTHVETAHHDEGFAEKQIKETIKLEKKVQEDVHLQSLALGKYTLQVGSFPSREEAQSFLVSLNDLKKKVNGTGFILAGIQLKKRQLEQEIDYKRKTLSRTFLYPKFQKRSKKNT